MADTFTPTGQLCERPLGDEAIRIHLSIIALQVIDDAARKAGVLRSTVIQELVEGGDLDTRVTLAAEAVARRMVFHKRQSKGWPRRQRVEI